MNKKNDLAGKTFPLNQIYFYLTDGCNLCCRHCWIEPTFQSEGNSYPLLSLELLRSIVEQGQHLGLSGVKLTGGEPLLHPEIHKILDYVKNESLDLTVETNGTLCTPEIARQIGACKNPFVSVSLDGADAETHEWIRGVPDCFEAALGGVHNLVQAEIKCQIIMSIMRHNKNQIESIVRLAESLGVESVKFNIIMPIARGERLQKNGETLPIEELVKMGSWVETILSDSTDLRLFFDHPAAFRPLGNMFGEKGDGCSTCGILGILGVLANGAYALCGIGESVDELVFGYAAKDRLEEIWKTSPIINELRSGLPDCLEGICGNCLMKGLCLGSCIAQNYYNNRHLWAPFWYCDEAKKAGIFPESRLCGLGG